MVAAAAVAHAMTGEATLTIGVDLGGTKVEAALVNDRGEIVGASRRLTGPERGASGVLADLVGCLAEDCLPAAEHPVLAVGVGVAGQVDPETGTVLHAPNLKWDSFPLKERLEEAIDLPVFVFNDVQAATYGEWTCGAGRGVGDLVCLFVGTGIGGGVVSHGSLVRGCGGTAGELGHTTIDWRGPPCTCRNRGCLEAFAAGWAIARRAREGVAERAAEGRRLLALADGAIEHVTAKTVAQAARDGDPLAERLVRETGEALGTGVASIANAFNPCLVILGGGVIEGMPQLVDLAAEEARRRALAAALRPLRVQRGELGRHAGTVGAALWARRILGIGNADHE